MSHLTSASDSKAYQGGKLYFTIPPTKLRYAGNEGSYAVCLKTF